MGNITRRLARTRDHGEATARIGVRLDAQRVDVYRFVDGSEAHLAARWCAPGACPDGPSRVSLGWFPWSLGNIRPEQYCFIRNAGALALAPGSDRTIAEIGMSSVVHLPIMDSPTSTVGAVCAYWSSERRSWDESARESVCELALEALSPRR